MEQEEYAKLLDDLREHRIEGFRFAVEGYGHYSSCTCRYVYDEFPLLKKRAVSGIKFTLSNCEYCMFHGPINENEKIFHIAGEGRLSFKYLRPRIKILEIYPVE